MGGRGSSYSSIKTYTLYHGSPDNIEKFDNNHFGINTQSGENLIYFTDSKKFADDFSYTREETDSMFFNRKGKKGNIYKATIQMKNPLNLANPSKKDIKSMLKMNSDGSLTDEKISRWVKYGNSQLLKTYIDLSKLKEYGYDGIIARTDTSTKTLEYGVIDSGQIKKFRKTK